MGGLFGPFSSYSSRRTRCDDGMPSAATELEAPPKMRKAETFGEKIWRKFSQQPLVPIGCATTAYFLASGIKSFRDRDPVKSQRMMKYRVMAQFVTLICFCGYIGYDNMDWRIAPMYQDAKKVRQYQKGQQESEKGTD